MGCTRCSDDSWITIPMAIILASILIGGLLLYLFRDEVKLRSPLVFVSEKTYLGPGRIRAKCVVNPDGTAILHLNPGKGASVELQ